MLFEYEITLKKLNELINKNKNVGYLNKYQEYIRMANDFKYSRGGLLFHYGIFSPEPLTERFVSNCNVGKQLKRIDKGYDYKYYFKDDQLILIEKFSDNQLSYIIFFDKIDDTLEITSFGCNHSTLAWVAKCEYLDNKLSRYIEASYDEMYNLSSFYEHLYTYQNDYYLAEYRIHSDGKYTNVYQIVNKYKLFYENKDCDLLDRYHFEKNNNGHLRYTHDKIGEFVKISVLDLDGNIIGSKIDYYDEDKKEDLSLDFEKDMKYNLYTLIVDKIKSWIDEDIYAISLFVQLEKDTPTVTLGYNTIAYCKAKSFFSMNEEEAKWNYAYWLQNHELEFGYGNSKLLVEQWIEKNNYIDMDSDEIVDAFYNVLVDIVQELHSSNIIKNKFKKDIPVIIHELEYYDKIAEYNIKANTYELVKDFIKCC